MWLEAEWQDTGQGAVKIGKSQKAEGWDIKAHKGLYIPDATAMRRKQKH